MRCRRANGTERRWFATKEEAEAFAADPMNVRYHGDIPVRCEHGCGWHLSAPHWPDAVAAQDNLTTEQLMEAALRTVQQMSPEEKAQARKEMDASVQKMRAALKTVPQLAPEETAKLREQLKLEVPKSGTLQEFVEGLELSYRALAPAERKQWLREVRKSCARSNRMNTAVPVRLGVLIARDGSSRMVRPENGVAFSHEEIGLFVEGGCVLVESERYQDYQQDRPELMTRGRPQ